MTQDQLHGITILALMPHGPVADTLLQVLSQAGAERVGHALPVELAERWLTASQADVLIVPALIARSRLPAIGYGGTPPGDAPARFAAWLLDGVGLADAVQAIRLVLER
jgi:hypothetical protein